MGRSWICLLQLSPSSLPCAQNRLKPLTQLSIPFVFGPRPQDTTGSADCHAALTSVFDSFSDLDIALSLQLTSHPLHPIWPPPSSPQRASTPNSTPSPPPDDTSMPLRHRHWASPTAWAGRDGGSVLACRGFFILNFPFIPLLLLLPNPQFWSSKD